MTDMHLSIPRNFRTEEEDRIINKIVADPLCPQIAESSMIAMMRYLQPGELRAVLKACPEWLRPIAGLAVATGMRRGEILGLRWLDLDFKGGRIVLPQTKNGDGRIVYLNALAQQALAVVPAKKAKPTDFVFAGVQMTPENVSLAFLRACRSVNVSDFRFHDLRHTAASWMRMKGADIHTVALILGQKDLRMAARYQHLSPAFLSDAVKLLDGAYAESPEKAENGASSGSIVTVALPEEKSEEADLALNI